MGEGLARVSKCADDKGLYDFNYDHMNSHIKRCQRTIERLRAGEPIELDVCPGPYTEVTTSSRC